MNPLKWLCKVITSAFMWVLTAAVILFFRVILPRFGIDE